LDGEGMINVTGAKAAKLERKKQKAAQRIEDQIKQHADSSNGSAI
jgi:hypothetical protein